MIMNRPAGGTHKVPNDLSKNKIKRKTSMNPPKIIAYLKPSCGWSQGVRAIMRKYTLAYDDRDLINNRSLHAEMAQKSGQSLSPCVEINGHMLADVSGAMPTGRISMKNQGSEREVPKSGPCRPQPSAQSHGTSQSRRRSRRERI